MCHVLRVQLLVVVLPKDCNIVWHLLSSNSTFRRAIWLTLLQWIYLHSGDSITVRSWSFFRNVYDDFLCMFVCVAQLFGKLFLLHLCQSSFAFNQNINSDRQDPKDNSLAFNVSTSKVFIELAKSQTSNK